MKMNWQTVVGETLFALLFLVFLVMGIVWIFTGDIISGVLMVTMCISELLMTWGAIKRNKENKGDN
ncbi:hypothetical protein [Pediococcus pentosaceus]|uniref:DUF1056 family protein n=1 Tax=Pediococcus pentosaceus TaxID=1255 RepID=A0ABD7X8X8_PEDPE|nr:hypothetical protein [Pediococcus pentosaceus]WEA58247.1 hypothetical protein PWB86_09570 [Pediococcus pentosaceus]